MARIDYDDHTAAAFKAVREIPRDGLEHWRAAVRRHLSPSPGMVLADVGAGTGAFATAFTDWFGVDVVAVEPSAAMRAQIMPHPAIRALAGDAAALPLADGSVDGVWLSLVLHHVPDLAAAAREFRRVLRPGAPVLIRQGFAGRVDPARTFPWEFFPEIAQVVTDTYPTVEEVCQAFAGFRRVALEQVPETLMSPAEFLARLDTFRRADTPMRGLGEEQFQRGRELLRRAAATAAPAPRTNWLDLLVLR